jgi:phosphatidylglycerol lysyltransferase
MTDAPLRLEARAVQVRTAMSPSDCSHMSSWIAASISTTRRLLHARWTLPLFAAAGMAGMVALLFHLLRDIDPAAVAAAVTSTSWSLFALSLLFSAVSYVTLVGYDAYAARLAAPGKSIPLTKLSLGAFTSYAVGHTLGFPLVTANAVRWRVYSDAGLSLAEVGKLAIVAGLTLGLGITATIGAGLIFEPSAVAALDRVPRAANLALGAAVLGGLAAFVWWCGRGERSVGKGEVLVRLPGARAILVQIGLGFIDVSAAAAALWVFLPPGAGVGLMPFTAVFALAVAGAILSHMPAGLGAFEAAVLLALPQVPAADLLSALVLWRLTYSLLPFALAIALLCGHELRIPGSPLARWIKRTRRAARSLAPLALGALTFAGGLVLLVSGATPSDEARLHALRHLVPLPFIELSHLVGSSAGVMLLIIARGLMRRLESAWLTAVAVLGVGTVVSLVKGFDWEEALVLGAVLGVLLASRSSFYRQAGLVAEPFSPTWLLSVAVVVLGSVCVGFLAYTNVEYSDQLWWSFAWTGDASRFIRGSVAAVVTASGIALYALVHRRTTRPEQDCVQVQRLSPIISQSARADGNLALLGDKTFLLHAAKDAFLMYSVRGRSWVAMGDPVGNPERGRDLLWRFLEMADAHDGWPVFYQISPELLPLYLDAGLSLVKLGEEAKVDLSEFTLEGSSGREWRHVLHRASREKLEFSIIPAADLAPYLPELKAVSDAWLARKGSGEKGFSVGSWSEAYLSRFDVAVVQQLGQVLAFANIWYGRPGGEITVDLMRHRPNARRAMDVLFVNLMVEAKAREYRWFNLGMAPLSGLSDHPLAPRWNKIATFLARNGEGFYGFRGLRAYKEKFRPVWEPRYLAYPGGWTLPQVLLDLTGLISGGLVKAFSK